MLQEFSVLQKFGLNITSIHCTTAFIGYLVGSIPFGIIMARLFGLGNIRQIGSGNIGATNVLRTGNKIAALLTLILDSSKGAIVILLFRFTFLGETDENLAMLAGLAVVIGHNFPIWLKFKGGKGIAVTFGVLLAYIWPVGVGVCLTWLLSAMAFRYSSLAAIISLIAAPIYAYFLSTTLAVILTLLLSLLGIARHFTNIKRLLLKTEPKITWKKC